MGSPERAGFTMLELSIVLIIIALVTTVGISTGVSVIESAKRSQTVGKLNVIEEALMTFRAKNHRLPCPTNLVLSPKDANYGMETSPPGTCFGVNFGVAGAVVEGGVPTRALSIPDEFMFDGWGRKIAYAVDSNATEFDAFRAISIPEKCGITVRDASGSLRSDAAIYALVSFGEDGHGGYLANGERMKSGSLNADVQINCHCDAEANTSFYVPEFVQREAFEDPQNPKKNFNHIVRFKERWQMLTEDDQFIYTIGGNYTGPNIAAGFSIPVGGNNSAYVYKMQCGRMLKQDDLDPVATESATGVAFTSNNRYLATFSDAGCVLYPIIDGEIQPGSSTAIMSCPAYDSSIKLAVSANDFMAMTTPNPPYIRMWQRSGSIFVPLATPSPAPGAPISFLALTSNYLLVADMSDLIIYGRSSGAFTMLPDQPTGVPSDLFSATISPNENYVAVTVDGDASGSPPPAIHIWRIDEGPVFTAKTPITIGSNDTPYSITFSPDGKYFAVGGTSGDNLMLYKIDRNDNFTRLGTPLDWTNSTDTPGIAFAFSKDSHYLAMGTASSAKPLVVFKKISAMEYKLLTLPDNVQPYGVLSIGFNQ